ncbi:MAG: hypothetical protein RL535_49 [Pseudomonadota bacterium]
MLLNDYLIYKKTRKAKFIIYTAISGTFDDLIQHTYVCKDADYVCYTDSIISDSGIWEIRPLEAKDLDRVRSAKYYKLFPQNLFPDAQYSFWIDGNIDVVNNRLEQRVNELIDSDTLISANIHFERQCAYDEAQVCLFAKLDDPALILSEIQYLEAQKFPRGLGLFEMNMIFRQHHRPENKQLMQSWWNMILKFSKRDQISFTYVLHQLKINCEKLFPVNSRLGSDFSYKPHNRKMHSILYVDTGQGFQAEQMVSAECFMGSGTSFSQLFNISQFSGVQQLRFDPVHDAFCSLRINKLSATMQDGSVQNVLSTDVNAWHAFNGVLNKNGFFDFDCVTPQIVISLSGHITQVLIQGDIYYLHPSKKIDDLKELLTSILCEKQQQDVRLVELQQSASQSQLRAAELQLRVQEIHASKTWRIGKALLWLPKLLFKRG